MPQLLDVLSTSFADKVMLRPSETSVLEVLNNSVRHRLNLADCLSGSGAQRVSCKVNLLLQCHLERLELNADLQHDQKIVLLKAVEHVHAMVDVMSSQCNLK